VSILFSKPCEYALQTVAYIALKPQGTMTSIKELTAQFDIPYHFLAKILQSLTRKRLLVSLKGPRGGFALGMSPKEITLFQIVEAIDGLGFMNRCVLGFADCGGSHPCAVHDKWEAVRNQIYTMLVNRNIEEIARDMKKPEYRHTSR
jgi:Rrf2 family transcriptional regulator, iron-sulfur cluster assembly transcription factor